MNNTTLAIILISILLFILGMVVKDILKTIKILQNDFHYHEKGLQNLVDISNYARTSFSPLNVSTKMPESKTNVTFMDGEE